MQILIINGPNLNLLGKREKEIYGENSFEDYYETLQNEFTNIDFEYFQNNVEGVLINKLHEVGFSYDAIVINAGAYTHTSIGIGDAIAGIETPVIEVHISNVLTRENFRHSSMIGPAVSGTIIGFGAEGYLMALRAAMDRHVKGINFL